MRTVNRLLKFVAILVTQIFYSLGLYLTALAGAGCVCTLILAVSEVAGFELPLSVWQMWLILSVPVWIGFEVYVAVKVYRLVHRK